MLNRIKSILPLLLMVVSLMGCTLFQQERELFGQVPISLPSTDNPYQNGDPSDSSSETTNNDQESYNSSTYSLDWQIEYRGDLGISRNNRATHLPVDKLVFIVTFNQEMDRSSVEEAFQKNITLPKTEQPINQVPILDYKWVNPLQVEITFHGENLAESKQLFTLSPNGAYNKEQTTELQNDKNLTFALTSNKVLYRVDLKGNISKAITTIPNSLLPIAQSVDGSQLLLARSYGLDTQGSIIPYLFDISSKKVTKIFQETIEPPFWGHDQKLHILNKTALVHISDEEQWIEFGDYPYIHGWSISPDLRYEIFLVSKELDPQKTMVSIMVKDVYTSTEVLYEDVLPMNDLDPVTGGIVHYPIRWMRGEMQIYISTFATTTNRSLKDYIFNIDSGELSVAPDYLQVENNIQTLSPAWSSNGNYVAVSDPSKQGGIYDRDGELLYEWSTYVPDGSLYWNPTRSIIAFEATTVTGSSIVQLDAETGKTVVTEGDYTILGWNADGTTLQIFQ